MKEFVFLALETSGLDPAHGELISLSALRLGKDCSERFCALLRPSAPLPELVEKLTGLTNTRLAPAPATAEAIRKFECWRRGDPIVLCRPKFDLPFLARAYEKAGLGFSLDLVHTTEEAEVKSLLWRHLFLNNKKGAE